MMDLALQPTSDGSPTLLNRTLGECYHSTNGALTESRHIFIDQGYHLFSTAYGPLTILEIGFGTGLNALLTLAACQQQERKVSYVAVEPYPPDDELLKQLNYPGLIGSCDERTWFFKMHHIPWEVPFYLTPNFILYKLKSLIQDIELQKNKFDLVYFDAFSPEVQPELWTEDLFQNIAGTMKPGGYFLTYSVKGQVRRNLTAAGLVVEKIPGPPGKREISRARKPD